MENSSDEVIKQILIQSDEREIQKLCFTNKRFALLCQDDKFMQGIYQQKAENTISPEIIAFKPLNMSWKEFCTRIYNLKNSPLGINEYCAFGDLLEIQILANMNPPQLPSWLGADIAAENGNVNVLTYIGSLGIFPTENAINWATVNGRLEVVQYLVSLDQRPEEMFVHIAAQDGHTDVVNYLASLDSLPN